MNTPAASFRPRAARPWLYPGLIAAATVAAYLTSFAGVFLFDDLTGLVNNPALRRLPDCLLHSSRPLTQFTFFLNVVLTGAGPVGFHAVNLLIHLAAALALYAWLRILLARAPALAAFAPQADTTAFAIALLWALHPLQTESVTYIVQRAESLAGLFALLTLAAATHSFAAGSDGSRKWQLAAIACCALGMGAKAVMVTVPLAVLLLDRSFFAGTFARALRTRPGFYALLAGTWTVAVVLLAAPNDSSTSVGMQAGLPGPARYLLTQTAVITHYLRLIILPRGLCLDYAWPQFAPAAAHLPAALALAALAGATLAACARRHPAGFAGAWFFLMLLPSSSVIPLADAAFEHRLYLALAGPVALTVGVAMRAGAGRVHPAAGFALLAAAALALGLGTAVRNGAYHSQYAMWQDVVAKRPGNVRARIDLAVALAERGQLEEARDQFTRALDRLPPADRADLESGRRVSRGMLQSNAVEYQFARAHINLGLMEHVARKRPDLAIPHYEAALRAVPWDTDTATRLKLARDRVASEMPPAP